MTIPFLIGLLSAVHCFGMCGGIVGALTMSLTPEIRSRNSQLFYYSLAYNLGRITSYIIAGLLIGWLGGTLISLIAPDQGLFFLRYIAAVIVILLGLYLGGWMPRLAFIERLGAPVWKKLQPLGQRLLPVNSPLQAFLFGIVWGWLPCGLVYYALLLSLAEASAISGGMYMMMFGLGTLTPMLLATMLAGKLNHIFKSAMMKRISGGLLILMGLISLILLYNPKILHSLHFIPHQEQHYEH